MNGSARRRFVLFLALAIIGGVPLVQPLVARADSPPGRCIYLHLPPLVDEIVLCTP